MVNYLTSHDDGDPFDKQREYPFKSANVLLLTPGVSQIYYGDESARDLTIKGTVGDATLRSYMNWQEIDSSETTKKILSHWQNWVNSEIITRQLERKTQTTWKETLRL